MNRSGSCSFPQLHSSEKITNSSRISAITFRALSVSITSLAVDSGAAKIAADPEENQAGAERQNPHADTSFGGGAVGFVKPRLLVSSSSS